MAQEEGGEQQRGPGRQLNGAWPYTVCRYRRIYVRSCAQKAILVTMGDPIAGNGRRTSENGRLEPRTNVPRSAQDGRTGYP